jgi:hypothetical protein
MIKKQIGDPLAPPTLSEEVVGDVAASHLRRRFLFSGGLDREGFGHGTNRRSPASPTTVALIAGVVISFASPEYSAGAGRRIGG